MQDVKIPEDAAISESELIDRAIEDLKDSKYGKKYPRSMFKGLKLKQRDTKSKPSHAERKSKRKTQKASRKANR